MIMKQSDAVYQAVVNVMGTQDEGAYVPTKEQRAEVNAILFEGFRSETIDFSPEAKVKAKDDKWLKEYCSGLQSNWLRKDKRLNGNTVYLAKNPGSRTGSTDPQVKAMKILLGTKTDPSEIAEIQQYIDKRLAEIKPTTKALTTEQIESLTAWGLAHLLV